MSTVNFFERSSATSLPVASAKAEAAAADWRNEPISGRQLKWIAINFRTKDLTAAPVEFHDRLKELAVYDDENHVWPEVGKLTKGEASDLLGMLKKLPNHGNGPIKTAKAEPVIREGSVVKTERGLRRFVKGRLVKA